MLDAKARGKEPTCQLPLKRRCPERAHLTELHASARPAAPRARADIVATAANLGGIGLGPLVSGLLAQYAGDALQIPYLVSEALMLLGVAALAAAPETAPRPAVRPVYRPQRVSVPHAYRSLYFAAGAAFKGCVSTVITIAPAGARAQVLAGLFLAGYVGLAIPVVGLGVAVQLLSARTALVGFAAVLIAVVAVVAPRLVRPAPRFHDRG
ncbi:MAG: hypothetical protein ACM3ML_33770 [Micromonosporaceae bacterium]